MNVTIKDIARIAGVSIGTVSNVVNNRPGSRMSKETRDKIEKLVKELNYAPQETARSLRTGECNSVLFKINDFGAFQTKLFYQLAYIVNETPYNLQFNTDYFNYHDIKINVKGSFRGIIAFDDIFKMEENKDLLKLPYISCGRNVNKDVDYVEIDSYAIFKLSYEYLTKKGCKKIAFLHDSWILKQKLDYIIKINKFIEDHNISLIPISITDKSVDFSSEIISYEKIKELIENKSFNYDGIICVSDEIALGEYHSLINNGYKVPKDVKLISSDGIFKIPRMDFPIASIDLRADIMAKTTWEFLNNRIADKDLPKQIRIIGENDFIINEPHIK